MARQQVVGSVESPIEQKPARFFLENRIQSLIKHARLVQNIRISLKHESISRMHLQLEKRSHQAP